MEDETRFFEFLERYRHYDNQFYNDFTTLKVTGFAPDQAIRRYYGVHTTLTTAGIYRENILLAVKNADWKLALDHLKLLANSKNVDLTIHEMTSREQRVELLARMKEVNASHNTKEEKLFILRSIAQKAESLDNFDYISIDEIKEEVQNIEIRIFDNQIPISDLSFNLKRLDKLKFEAERRKNSTFSQQNYFIPNIKHNQRQSDDRISYFETVNGFNGKPGTKYNKIQESANARIWNDAEHTIPHLISKAYISKPKQNYPKTVKFQNSLTIKLQKSPIKKKKEYRRLDSSKYNYATTGHPRQAESIVKRKVSDLATNNKKIYIGKTSGYDGLRKRFNNQYKKLGFDSIVPIYTTSSEDYAYEVEAMTIDYAKKQFGKKVKNVIGGGGGSSGSGSPKIVYVAMKK